MKILNNNIGFISSRRVFIFFPEIFELAGGGGRAVEGPHYNDGGWG